MSLVFNRDGLSVYTRPVDFQNVVESVLADYVVVINDNILTFGKNPEELANNLEQVGMFDFVEMIRENISRIWKKFGDENTMKEKNIRDTIDFVLSITNRQKMPTLKDDIKYFKRIMADYDITSLEMDPYACGNGYFLKRDLLHKVTSEYNGSTVIDKEKNIPGNFVEPKSQEELVAYRLLCVGENAQYVEVTANFAWYFLPYKP